MLFSKKYILGVDGKMKDLTFLDALKLILEFAVDNLRKENEYNESIYKSLISSIFASAIEFYGLNKKLC